MPKNKSNVLIKYTINIKRQNYSYENNYFIVVYFNGSKFYEIPNKNFKRTLIRMFNKNQR